MIGYSVRALWARKLRTALTALAIVLGVAMISGTYVLTDTIKTAFDTIFSESYRGTDVVLTARTAFDTDVTEGGGGDFSPTTLPETLLDRVREVDGVGAALGGVAGPAQLVQPNGEVIGTNGAPPLGFSVDPEQPQFNRLTLVRGSWPGPNEVAIDEATAERHGYAPGDTVGVATRGPAEPMELSGIVRFGAVSSIGGATLAAFDLRTAQRLFDKEGRLDQIRVSADEGVAAEGLIGRLRSELGDDVRVRSGQAQASRDAAGPGEFIDFLQQFLLAFGGVALFVGSFVIANTLSITIAQRTREFATLRTIGGSRRQVLTSVISEALVTGIAASVLGLFLGLALAKGLNALFERFGIDLPQTGLVFAPRTIVVALTAGIVVTLLASIRPAIRATRVPPIAAVREGATLPESRWARFRAPGAAVVVIGGFAALANGLFRDGLGTTAVLAWLGLGALQIFLGAALFAPNLVRPLAEVLGWPATRIGGAAGDLARENARRNPARTAGTASALMIGLALVTLVAVLAAGIRTTFLKSVDELFVADYAITSQDNFTPLPTSVADAVAGLPGVRSVVGVRTGQARILGGTRMVSAVDPDMSTAIALEWVEGDAQVPARLGADGAFLNEDFANDHDLRVGSRIELLTPGGETLSFTVRGVFDEPTGGSPFGPVTISSRVFDANYERPTNQYTFFNTTGGVDDATTKRLAAALERPFPNAKVQDRETFKDNQIAGLNSVLNILYVLLALSVIVSLFGIVNTLALAVYERTRELGLLRAIGMTRRQVRRMIRHESVVTALIGAVLGIALGVALGALLVARVEFIEFTLPVVSLIVFTIAAIVVGIVAAIIPARRASRLNVLQALQYE